MSSKKIVCLGGGSLYFRRVLPDLVMERDLAGSEVTLYDIDTEKAELMAAMGARLSEEAGAGMKVRACADLADAVDGADFAVSSIGGSGKSGTRVYGTPIHQQDLAIPARYGIYQIVGDTGGPAGMMMGLRSIPVYLDICREMEKRCPDVVFCNHSNPMAILCRAMIKHAGLRQVICICHGVQGGLRHVGEILEVPPGELDAIWIGTNHYYWFTRIRHQGRDVYPELRRRAAGRTPKQGHAMCAELSEIYGYQITYPDDAHVLEFYPFLAQARDAASVPYGFGDKLGPQYEALLKALEPDARPADDADQRQADLKEYTDQVAAARLPDQASDPITGEGLGVLIAAIATGRRHVHIVNIPNQGAIPNLPEYAVVEIEGVTDSCGVRGVHVGEAPLSLMGLLQKRIAWQELVVEAGVKGDRRLALQAMLMDEMAIPPRQAEAMLDELLAASREYLPQFST